MYAFSLLLLLQQSSAPDFVAKTIEAETAQAAERRRYAFHETQRNWDGKNDDTSRERGYELVFVEGALYRKLVSRNGKALSGSEARKVEEALSKERAARRQQRRAGRLFFPGTRYMRIGNFRDLPKLFDAVDQGEENVNGQPARKIAFRPKPGATPGNDSERETLAYDQVFWIHPEEHVILQHQATVTAPGVDLLPGSVITIEYRRPAPEMPYMAVRTVIQFTTKVFSVRTARGRQEHTYDNFRRFDVESSITFEEPKL
jgi:hypothetical protein